MDKDKDKTDAVDVGYDRNDKGSDILLNGNYNEETRGDNGDFDV